MTTQHPYKVVTVELLIPSDKGRGDVCEALREIRTDTPICEYAILSEEPISGLDAEERFDQPDLEYPDKFKHHACDLLQRVRDGEDLGGHDGLMGEIARFLNTAKG